jgi:hypothetical protein
MVLRGAGDVLAERSHLPLDIGDGANLVLLSCEHAGLQFDELSRFGQGLFGMPCPLGLQIDARG